MAELWSTPMSCHNEKAIITTDCKKGEDEFSLNECKKPQTISFSASDKRNIPEFTKSEEKEYKAAGTYDLLFATSWACLKINNEVFYEIYYSINTGNAAASEKTDYYTSNGKLVDNKAYMEKIPPHIRKNAPKKNSVRSIFPE